MATKNTKRHKKRKGWERENRVAKRKNTTCAERDIGFRAGGAFFITPVRYLPWLSFLCLFVFLWPFNLEGSGAPRQPPARVASRTPGGRSPLTEPTRLAECPRSALAGCAQRQACRDRRPSPAPEPGWRRDGTPG